MSVSIRFYDNEIKNWEGDMVQHSPAITFIEVDNETPNQYIQTVRVVGKATKKNTQETYNREYINFFASNGNGYAMFLKRIMDSGGDTDKFLNKDYPSNGVLPNIPEMLQWAETTRGDKCIIFDWDKTITAVEGMYFESFHGESIANYDVPTILQFIMGGPERLDQMIRSLRTLQSYGVQMFIITNNPNAASRADTRGLYLHLIGSLFSMSPEQANDILFSAKDYGFKKWKSACAIRILTPFLNCAAGSKSTTVDVAEEVVSSAAKKTPSSRKKSSVKAGKAWNNTKMKMKMKMKSKFFTKKHNKSKKRKYKR